MIELIAILPPVAAVITALVLTIKLRKKDNPAGLARIFAFAALAFGIVFLLQEFFPFEYTGEDGIDHIADALLWGLFVNTLLYTTLTAYVSFAASATFFAVKAFKAKDKHRNNVISLVIAWICGIVIAFFMLTGFVLDRAYKKKISIEVEAVTETTDTDGNPAVIIVLELHNDSNRDISYFTFIYDEVMQNGKELYYTVVNEVRDLPDTDLEVVEPGGSVIITQSYELKYPDEPVRILCRTYSGDFVYVDSEYYLD